MQRRIVSCKRWSGFRLNYLTKVNFIKSGNSITYINNMGCDIKITECEFLQGS